VSEEYLELTFEEPGAGTRECVQDIAELVEKFRRDIEDYVERGARTPIELADDYASRLDPCTRKVYESVRRLTPTERVLIEHGLKNWWYTIYWTTNK